MLNQERARELFKKIRKFSTSDQVEMLIGGGKSALTRFANNTILQNVADENYDVSVRVQFGGRTARASTNKWDEESLRRVVHSAEELARVQEEDPDLLPMYDGKEGGPLQDTPGRFHEPTAVMGAAERAEQVAHMVEVANKGKLNSSGVYATSQQVEGIFNSLGVERWHQQTMAEASVTMTAPDSTGWQKANSPNAGSLDARAMAETAADKARRSASPKEIAAGKYTVVLEPSAVLDIVGFMFWDFGGLSLLDQRSFLNNRMGKRIFGENINIVDDPRHPLQSGAAWDGEGVPREPLTLVENGVVKNLVYARGSAARLRGSEFASQLTNARPTGHGFPLPNEMGEAPMNVVFEVKEKKQAVNEMIKGTERGILVTRLWYIREVDPYEKILTGMTRDGTFLIENGQVTHGLRNFRFNESLLHMLSSVEALGEPVRASGEEAFDMVVPAMKVRDFNFTEVTKF
jgi:predicted Zn-dependent protease